MNRGVLFLILIIQCLVAHGQRYDSPRVELLDNDGIYDSFCIGDVMFVSLESDVIYSTAQGKRGFENVPALNSVVQQASPSKQIQEFVDHLLGYHHAFAFESATVFDCGDSGFRWDVKWSLYPSPGGSSGIPFEYHSNLLQDETVAPHQLILCDHYETDLFTSEGTIISWLPLTALTSASLMDEGHAVDLATAKLGGAIKDASLDKEFRAAKRERQTYPSELFHRKQANAICNVWAIEFVPKSTPVENERNVASIKIWVAPNGTVSNVDVGQWALE